MADQAPPEGPRLSSLLGFGTFGVLCRGHDERCARPVRHRRRYPADPGRCDRLRAIVVPGDGAATAGSVAPMVRALERGGGPTLDRQGRTGIWRDASDEERRWARGRVATRARRPGGPHPAGAAPPRGCRWETIPTARTATGSRRTRGSSARREPATPCSVPTLSPRARARRGPGDRPCRYGGAMRMKARRTDWLWRHGAAGTILADRPCAGTVVGSLVSEGGRWTMQRRGCR